jgi:hypothetical protein
VLFGLRRRLFPERDEFAPGGSALPPARAAAPRLEHADDLAEAARRRAESEPGAALRDLEGLCDSYAPEPAILHALCMLYHRAGRPADALRVARQAIPLCFKRGRGLLAAEIFESMEGDAAALGFGRDELLAIGGALGRTTYWPLGFRALASVLMRDPADADAVRDLVRIADHLDRSAKLPDEAARILQFLLVVAEDTGRHADWQAKLSRLAPDDNRDLAGPPGSRWDDFVTSLER